MRTLLALVGAAALSLPPAPSGLDRTAASAPLRVVRVTPVGEGAPNEAIAVMFDRPVAGGLERSVDPARVMRVEPEVPGRFEWRDPVTLRFIPAAPFAADTRVTVTVSTDFEAMDGARLAEPHRATFRIRGPRLLAERPVTRGGTTINLAQNQRFDFVYSEPVDAALLAQSAVINFATTCFARPIELRVESQRRISADDGYQLTEAGGWQRDRSLDSLRRVVTLAPRSPLPRDCAGELLLPAEVAKGATAAPIKFYIRTHGPLRLSSARCGWSTECPTGPIRLEFSTPVRGADVKRFVSLVPAVAFNVSDTNNVSTSWTLEAQLAPRTAYAVVADTALRDVFAQRLTGNPAVAMRTTGYAPQATYPFGRQLVERIGFQTLPIEHINADTLVAEIAAIPDSLERQFLSRYAWGLGELWGSLAANVQTQRLPTRTGTDRGGVTGLRLPQASATAPGAPTIYAVRVRTAASARTGTRMDAPISLVQVTDLGVTARVGADEATVWVTGVNDGKPRGDATVVLHDNEGRVVATARSDARGIARLRGFAPPPVVDDGELDGRFRSDGPTGGYVAVTLGADRAVVPISNYDPDLSPWVFGMREAWDNTRFAVAGAVFTERGIYRPGEEVYAKAILRDGPLGSLRTPSRGDSLRWAFTDREGRALFSRTVALSAFGTADQRFEMPASAPVGQYGVIVALKRMGRWRPVARASYRVAEYRPPEFLMDLVPQLVGTVQGDSFTVLARGRYLFGAPMARAALNWEARHEQLGAWELRIPGVEDWTVGRRAWTWDEYEEPTSSGGPAGSGIDTLDAAGERVVRLKLPELRDGAPTRLTLAAAITDVNRQVVGNTVTTLVHPAAIYVAVRSRSASWFWREGQAETMSIRTVRPDGTREGNVEVRGTLVRREWHQVRRERNGAAQLVGEWVSDTVGRCTVTTRSAADADCVLTPTGGGLYVLRFEARDAAGRSAVTTMSRWVAGRGFVPWSDETQFKMELIADRERYSPGDTATILIAAPFTGAEAWLTVERERVLESRRLLLTDGAMTVRIPITEAHAPNAFVSVVMVRGRSAPPGRVDDPGRPTLRVGYTELRVTPEVKRLQVAVAPQQAMYLPGDTAQLRVQVRDRSGAAARSEVTLWAVDEGVLALTRYKTPDPIDLLYAPRALGQRLASNLVSVTPQVPEGEKGQREAGGGGGAGESEILRSRFKTTAFFLGSVVTDSTGAATVRAKLPDNLTTFRVMAVAVTAGDRYGSGESPMLVTRELVARSAMPRFVRPGDDVSAGTALNRRDGAAREATVTAAATGVRLASPASQTLTLAQGRGADVRFRFIAQPGDSATFTFQARSGRDADAVRTTIPVKPDFHPRAHVISGALVDSATATFELPANIDPARSLLTLSVASSPLAMLRGSLLTARVYPYNCTEQITAAAMPIIALLRAPAGLTERQQADARADLARAVEVLTRRQRSDGGIGYWSPTDWTTPWLSAHAGLVLLEANSLAVPVDTAVMSRLATYLRTSARGTAARDRSPLSRWYDLRATQLGDQLAAADFLSRLGAPEVAAENELVRMASQMRREDRLRLAEVLLRRGQRDPARALLQPAWDAVKVEGRRATIDTTGRGAFYFSSRTSEMARLLTATLRFDPSHPLIAPMVETVASQGRIAAASRWNTQDLTAAVRALAAFEETQRSHPPRTVRVLAGSRTLVTTSGAGDTSVALTGLLGPVRDESRALRLSLAAGEGRATAFYYLTVTEVPLEPPVRPVESGIRVERWYERFSDGTPVTSVTEGELVRVRIRVTVDAERQFVVLDDPLPAGLEAIDLSLRTASTLAGPGVAQRRNEPGEESEPSDEGEESVDEYSYWGHGRWDSGWWSPWEHREIRDDRVRWSTALLWRGVHTATYVARATTAGTFVRPPAHAEEMYNPAVNGRSEGGTFRVVPRGAPR